MTHVMILGAGAWGTALAQLAAVAGNRVTLLGRDAARMAEMAQTRLHPALPELALSPNIAMAAGEAAADATHLVCAIPAQHAREALSSVSGAIGAQTPVILTQKGIEQGTLALPMDVAAATLPGRSVAILSGPSFAGDVAAERPTAVALAAGTLGEARALAHIFATPTFRPYPSADPLGAQLGGALKNVLAIACGAVMGAGLGESARAGLMARGYAEMRRLAQAMGSDGRALEGLAGLGDLVLTCGSRQSRNFDYGYRLATGALEGAATTCEGVATAASVGQLAARVGADMPICAGVRALIDGASVAEVARGLLDRDLASAEI